MDVVGVIMNGSAKWEYCEVREEVSGVLGLTYIIAMPGGSSLRKKSLMESQGIKAKQQKHKKTREE